MGLRDLQLPSTTIETPNGEFAVRGLSFADIVTVVNEHGPAAAMVFAKLSNGEKIAEKDVRTVLASVAPQFPDLIAALLALASDDYSPEAVGVAKRLSFNVQVEALEAIFNNTFQSEAELKKFMESAIRMLTGTTNLVKQARLPLSDLGFGASDDK